MIFMVFVFTLVFLLPIKTIIDSPPQEVQILGTAQKQTVGSEG